MRLLGLEPDREHTRVHQTAMRPYINGKRAYGESRTATITTNNGCQQAIYSIHDQMFGSCAGESIGACIEARVNYRISSIGIWRDARRRQGNIEELSGTRFEYCIESLERRGWDRYEAGEETNVDEMTKPDDLDSEMEAFDNRDHGLQHWRISTFSSSDQILESVDSAIDAGYSVVFGTGVQRGYQDYHASTSKGEMIVGTDWLGGEKDGHAQRIFARRVMPGGERHYGVQGSWGLNWGGMTSLTGKWLPGCCWVREEVLLVAWDIHVLHFSNI